MLPPITHSRDPRLDISQARQVLKDALRTHDAREIVRWLKEHTHELTRSRFFELMFSFGPLAGTLLNAVGRLVPAERRLLGESLGRAFALGAVLTASGVSFDHVVRCTIYLVDLADFATVNKVYGQAFRSAPPARATVQVTALPKGARVEIDAIAVG